MKIATVLAAVTVALAALIASVSAAENPPNPEQSERASNAIETELLLRSACKEYVAIHSEGEALEEAMVSASDVEKLASLFRLKSEQESRLSDAEQPVINQLSDDEIERLRAIADVQRAVNTARDDYEWPYYGTVDRLLVELMGTAWDTREAAIVHFCTRGRRAG